METLKAIKTASKGKRRTELIGLVSEAITHDDIFGTINYRNKSEDEIKQFIYPHLVDRLVEREMALKPHWNKTKTKAKTKTKTKKTKKAKKKQKGDSAMHIKTDIDDDLDLFMAKLQENNAREAQLQIEDLKKSIGTLEKRLGISNKVILNLKEQNLLLIKKLNSTK